MYESGIYINSFGEQNGKDGEMGDQSLSGWALRRHAIA
jgi:hypothetical protein